MVVSTSTVLYEKRDHVAYITLNRPDALNALNREIRVGIREAMVDFRDDADMLVAVLTGAGGRAFSAGMDLKERARQNDEPQERSAPAGGGGGSFIDWGVIKPIIAAIDGFCVAGGLELTLHTHRGLCLVPQPFGLPGPLWGRTAGYGLHTLSRMVPHGEALYMQLTGRRINAQRAYEIGLIQEVVEDRDELFVMADRIAGEIKQCAPLAVQAIKQIVYQGRNLPVEYSQKLAAPLNVQVQATEDAKEGPRAFSEKRAPVWKMR